MGKASAIWPAGWAPLRSKSSTARRVGSASAWNVISDEYVTERFRIMRNYRVTDWRLSRGNFEENLGLGHRAETARSIPAQTHRTDGARSQRLAQMGGDLFAVEAAVLDKDLAGARSGHDYTGHVDAWDIALERDRIAHRPLLLSRQLYADTGQEVEVRMVPGERKNEIVLQALRTSRSIKYDVIGADLEDRTVEVGNYFSGLDAVLDVGAHPIFDIRMDLGSAMDQRHARAMTPEIKSGLRSRVLAANYDHVVIEVRMSFTIVVEDLGKVFARGADLVGEVVITGGDNDLAGAVVVDVSLTIGGCHSKVPVFAVDRFDPVVLANLQLVMLGGTAVVLEGFLASGLHQRGGERDLADLEQLRCGEKCHVGRIVEDRIDEASLVKNDRLETSFLRLNGAGQSSGTGAHDEDVSARVALGDGLSARESFGNDFNRQECDALI